MWYERRVSHNGRMIAKRHSLAARGIKTKRSPIGRTTHLHDNLGFKNLGYLKGRTGKTINAYDKSGHHIASASYYHMPGRMELAILGVDPEHQSEGIGSQMVDLVIQKQERLGSYLYVIAEPDRRKKGALVRFYESKGFKKLKPLEGNRWVMVRPPTGKMPTSVYNRRMRDLHHYHFKETKWKGEQLKDKYSKTEDGWQFTPDDKRNIPIGGFPKNQIIKGHNMKVVLSPTMKKRQDFYLKNSL
jgi:ribosomal protein S18 acetylase RimI-like enzyme